MFPCAKTCNFKALVSMKYKCEAGQLSSKNNGKVAYCKFLNPALPVSRLEYLTDGVNVMLYNVKIAFVVSIMVGDCRPNVVLFNAVSRAFRPNWVELNVPIVVV